jgi:hypothetical protein
MSCILKFEDFKMLKEQSAVSSRSLTGFTPKNDVKSEAFCPGYIYFQFSYGLPPSTTNTTFAVGVRSGVCVEDESLSYTLRLTCSNFPVGASNVIVTYYSDTICGEILGSSVLTDFQRGGPYSGEDGDSIAQLGMRGRVSLGEELRLDFKAVILRCVLRTFVTCI